MPYGIKGYPTMSAAELAVGTAKNAESTREDFSGLLVGSPAEPLTPTGCVSFHIPKAQREKGKQNWIYSSTGLNIKG